MSGKPITIIANGKETILPESCTLDNFIKSCGWKPTQVVVEYNAVVVGRSDVSRITLQDGDCLEIIVPVAGG
jgi:thiamine biosynthesis protein ThiS